MTRSGVLHVQCCKSAHALPYAMLGSCEWIPCNSRSADQNGVNTSQSGAWPHPCAFLERFHSASQSILCANLAAPAHHVSQLRLHSMYMQYYRNLRMLMTSKRKICGFTHWQERR